MSNWWRVQVDDRVVFTYNVGPQEATTAAFEYLRRRTDWSYEVDDGPVLVGIMPARGPAGAQSRVSRVETRYGLLQLCKRTGWTVEQARAWIAELPQPPRGIGKGGVVG